ncbi:unnamed protein product [Schistocephalus solidus]|uniref:Pecanex-like protein n=1 Tax=Schistocephalus solidus TaxID=70667 RepID=A0A183TQK4_SCHSO|nr:unnamed protein product [Schistocephalus solidus]
MTSELSRCDELENVITQEGALHASHDTGDHLATTNDKMLDPHMKLASNIQQSQLVKETLVRNTIEGFLEINVSFMHSVFCIEGFCPVLHRITTLVSPFGLLDILSFEDGQWHFIIFNNHSLNKFQSSVTIPEKKISQSIRETSALIF